MSDFKNIYEPVERFNTIYDSGKLAFEAFKQVLLDEEVKIGTYNKFLKIMQIIEWYQRDSITDEEELSFIKKKNEIIDSLADLEQKEFINEYTTYNGQNFRKCLNGFTYDSLRILGISKTKALKKCDHILSDIKNDRDVYTHASKNINAKIPQEKLMNINYLFKTLFRINVLSKIGMPDQIIKRRLLHDRRFVLCLKDVFDLVIEKDENYYNTGEFDRMMW